MFNENRARELSEFVGLERRVCLKPEYAMERETAQDEMLGALEKMVDIDDAYVRLGSVVAVIGCAMSHYSDGTNYISLAEATSQDETSSDDPDNIDKVDKIEASKIMKSIDHK